MRLSLYLLAAFVLLAVVGGTAYARARGKAQTDRAVIRAVPMLSKLSKKYAQSLRYEGNKAFTLSIASDGDSDILVRFSRADGTFHRIDLPPGVLGDGRFAVFASDDGVIAVSAGESSPRGVPLGIYSVRGDASTKIVSIPDAPVRLTGMTGVLISKQNRIFFDEDGILTLFDGKRSWGNREILPGLSLQAVAYDRAKDREYSAWRQGQKYFFKVWTETGYSDVAVYDRAALGKRDVWDSKAFIIHDDFFVIEGFSPDMQQGGPVFAHRIVHLGPGKEAAEVGTLRIPWAETAQKLIALPDGRFALLFRSHPALAVFAPGSPSYRWWLLENAAFREMRDCVFAEGAFWLFGQDSPNTLLIEVPEKALREAAFPAQ